MENSNIKNLNIEDFKQAEQWVDYVDDDLLITGRIEDLPYSNDIIRINFFLIAMCLEGRLQFEINGKPYQIEANETLICLPTMILCHGMHSAGAKIQMIGFSSGFMQRTVKQGVDMRKAFNYLFQNPIRHAKQEEPAVYMHHYGELISAKLKDTQQRYRSEIMESLFSALIYEMLSDIHRHLTPTADPDDQKSSSRRVFGRFLEALSADGGRHRSLSYYADLLCYSPKYVSAVVKQSSGRTALDWINEYTMQHIKHELKHSNQSMKEIAEMFEFPNQSFFGKYVKAHLGMSPAKYRNSDT